MNTKDRNGVVVGPGDHVRLLSIKPSVLGRVSAVDRARLEAMIGNTFCVYEVDEWGGAWIKAEWNEDGGRITSHSLMLGENDMERIPGKHQTMTNKSPAKKQPPETQ